MKRVKTVFQKELILLLRNKFFAIPLIINLLCWGYIIISYEIQGVHYEETAAVFYRGFIWMLLLNLLIIGLIAVYLTSKDRETKFEPLMASYHVKNMEWILGKWLVAQLYGVLITVLTVAIQALWFIGADMSLGEWSKHLVYVFVQMEGALFFIISFGFLFGTLIKNMFAYLSIPVILLLTLALPFDNVGTALTYDNPRFHLLTPFDYMFIGTPYEGIWGIERVFAPTILHQIGVFLLGIVLISITLWIFRPNRRSHQEKRLILLLVTIFLISTVVVSGFRYMQYEQALKKLIETGKTYAQSYSKEVGMEYYEWMNSYYDEHLDDEPYEFAMEKADLKVQLLGNDELRVQSKVTIKNNGEAPVKDVELTLYHGLTVKECTSPAGVTCIRDGDWITLQFDEMMEPEGEMEVSLEYEGNILQYRYDGYVEQAFIDKNRIYLPKEAGWYPLIGKRSLVIAREHEERYFGFEMRNARLVEDYPTNFTVEIESEDLPIALTVPKVEAGFYKGDSFYGLSLIGGNFKEETVGETRILAHPEALKGAKDVAERYQKASRFVEGWLGIPMVPSVIFVMNDEHYYLSDDTVNQGFLVWGNRDIQDSNDEQIAYRLQRSLFQERSDMESVEDVFLLEDAMIWPILHHLQGESTFKEWYKSLWWNEDDDLTLVDILSSYEEESPEQFQDVVKYLYYNWTQLENGQEFDMTAALKLYEKESGR
ncbi:ABC transporter permease [Bacillus niameyensis]|uniref:ABC transporter permease n=1 Tax=Bacillus niameyensis TaxID=1522308 RepID=UPI000780D767|nr:ABC transporter permease [Bacillus niameyensis]